jgi:hypothetical protein
MNMSERRLASTITREIRAINEEIDLRIVRGMPYKKEAKLHRRLVSLLNHISEESMATKTSLLTFLL